MNETEEWEKVLKKLASQTDTGDVTWQVFSRPVRENLVGYVYMAEVKNKKIVIYEYSYRHYADEDVWEDLTDVAVEFVSHDGTLEWRIPAAPARHELLNAVRKATAGAGDFLAEFLEPDW